ncbi:MAG: 4-alpha-glucanotransferase [Oscillospiraceae bacterium]|nr:4-alpha-glucanotransferase [Oscillospiraceae bacterium]
MKRESGILLHISSLPTKYGIGTLGQEAYRFIDFLKAAGQRYWQVLPIGPTSYGDSPYQSCSVYAGNPYFVDIDTLLKEGLLEPEDLEGCFWGKPGRVDYAAMYHYRLPLLERAYRRGRELRKAEFAAFRAANPWVEDYALFMALKQKFGGLPWNQWPEKAARRDPEALKRYREELKEDISCCAFTQYLFSEQWDKLFAYAKKNGIKIIGDIPIYVTLDSCDVWLNPELFQLDASGAPIGVAGCPPDGFSEDGQLWGNPLYDWPKHEQTGFAWWIQRVRASARFFDVIRIDHFRGLESYWAVPFGEETARNGKWVKGPGMKLVNALRNGVPEVDFIAEDLGYQTPEVEQLLRDSGFPGMKVLEFAFYGDNGDYLPHNHTQNSVCYIGTHDNYTLAQWLDEEDEEIVEKAVKYLALTKEEGYIRGFLRSGMGSVSKLFVAQMQDWLELGAEARMNAPGELSTSNWSWRLKELPDKKLAAEILEMTKRYARTGEPVHA